ncbi:hypothetical protein CU048_12135 [Beijerinckiaceae bacterium]|nr:hypothetical protein CU048_12135 [Beijerinckiaceae bacterium]
MSPFADASDDRVCIDGPIWITRAAHEVLEELTSTRGCALADLLEGLVQTLGDDLDLLSEVSGARDPEHEPEVELSKVLRRQLRDWPSKPLRGG